MTCIEIDLQARRALGARGRNHLNYTMDCVRNAWHRYWMRRAQRATVLILQSLDDRTLRDIGISPSEITSCVYGEALDRRRRYCFGSERSSQAARCWRSVSPR
jgi:uncharacterized protein YjiS (DUF1127 family)